jgi:hypothetical protein
LVLLVDPTTGRMAIRSEFSSTAWIDEYSIFSPTGSLNPAFWNSLDDQNAGSGAWVQTTWTDTLISESDLKGETSLQNGTGFDLGFIFDTLEEWNVMFHYRLAGSDTPSLGIVTFGFPFPPLLPPVQEPMPCHGDINGTGAVNIDDLLLVINAWGSCSPPPATCPADIAPWAGGGQGGNGTVNVDDLLAVINAWGSCPE